MKKFSLTFLLVAAACSGGGGSGSSNVPTDQDNNTHQIDDNLSLQPNNPKYCGYDFELETDETIIGKISSQLSQNWQDSTPGYSVEGGNKKYRDGLNIDLAGKKMTSLKLYFEVSLSPTGGIIETITETKTTDTMIAGFFLSKPFTHKDFPEPPSPFGQRLLVMSTPDKIVKCQAMAFTILEDYPSKNKDTLYATSMIGSSSYGNAVKAIPIADFFEEHSMGPAFEIKKLD